MFKKYFEGIENIEVGPIISLTIFFIFFLILLYRVFKMDKGAVKKLKDLPLDDNKE